MKAVNKKSFLLVIALALVFSLTVGLTLAYFSDHNVAKGKSTIALGGKTEIQDEYNEDEKTVVIKNTGDVPVVARVSVYAPIVNETQTATVSGEDWQRVPAAQGEESFADDDAYWYYTKVIYPKGESSPLIVDTRYLKTADLGDVVNVVVTHESSQIAYDADGKIIAPSDWDEIDYVK